MGNFRERIAKFMADTGIKPTTLGKRAIGDSRFIFDVLLRGRSPGIDTVASITRWMRTNRKRVIAECLARDERRRDGYNRRAPRRARLAGPSAGATVA